jgi:hypothetical protein
MLLTANEINSRILGFSDVLELAVSLDPAFGRYELRMFLSNSQGDTITLRCGEVWSLNIAAFGGGLTQFLGLCAHDVRARQLDRTIYYFLDREREQIAFYCRTVDISPDR